MKHLFAWLIAGILVAQLHASAGEWVTYPGKAGPGKGKHIVLLAGDEEYRSEEGLPMLGKILSQRHGFKCTVLFSLNPTNGDIDPNNHANIPGMAALDSADLVIMLWRFRELPDDRMKHFVDYFLAGKPFIALRTSTHAFSYDHLKNSPYAKYDWHSKEWSGGFGKQVLGETWVDHWGHHKSEATRGVLEATSNNHPILRGVLSIFADTDVYEAHPPADAKILVWGQVLKGMKPDDAPAERKRKTNQGVEQPVNDPMQPVAWWREYVNEAGKRNKIVTTTMGSATDLQDANLRRLLINASYWAVGLEKKIKPGSNVDYVGEFKPTFYGFNEYKRGMKPADHELK